jgi:hypothetical protein
MLGETIYFLDFKNKTVVPGVVYDVHVTSTGHSAYQLLVDDQFRQVECSLCYPTVETAEFALKQAQPLADKINTFAKESQAKIDAMREELLGKPQYTHLRR